VTVAENGLVAIKLFEESYRERRHDGEPLYHAILMDIQMPVIGNIIFLIFHEIFT
jgi:CheY-like chemotaxis protein